MNTRTFFKSLAALVLAPLTVKAAKPRTVDYYADGPYPRYVLVRRNDLYTKYKGEEIQLDYEELIHPKEALKRADHEVIGHKHDGKLVRYAKPGHPWTVNFAELGFKSGIL
jgi:hypothetical protein